MKNLLRDRIAVVAYVALLVVFSSSLPASAHAQGNGDFQVVALNRLMQVMSDALLPLQFNIPTGNPQQLLQAQVVDAWYCGGNADGTASLVAVVFPGGHTLPRRLVLPTDCSDQNLASLNIRAAQSQNRPDWFAISFVTVRAGAGKLALSFAQPVLSVKAGTSAPSAVIALFHDTTSAFDSIDTSQVSLSANGQQLNFRLDFLFQSGSAVIFGSDPGSQATLQYPPDVTLANLLPTMNVVVRLPHITTKALLGGPLKAMTYPITVSGQTFIVSQVQINGTAGHYQTMGVVSSNGIVYHLTVNWAGSDLIFQSASLAEAQVSCKPLDVACKAHKALAVALQSLLNGMVPPSTPMRPNSSVLATKVRAGGKTYRLRLAVERSSSTTDSLQLFTSLLLEPQ